MLVSRPPGWRGEVARGTTVGVREVLGRTDDLLGAAIERTQRAHHRRRLRRLGYEEVFVPESEPGLFAAGRAPTGGNAVDVLIDGQEALSAMAEAVQAARSSVHLACWHADPDFQMLRDREPPVTLRDLLAGAAERVPVRVLLWAGPPLPVYQPTRSRVHAVRDALTRGTRVQCELDARERTLHCHHEKILVVDGEVAFVGGLDPTTLQGDRHDSTTHEPRGPMGWHDVAVRLRGPSVADVGAHFAQRWSEVAGAPLPAPEPPPPAGATRVQVVRTLPDMPYRSIPRGEFTILDTYLRAITSAQRLVYLENQFLWSPEITNALLEKLRHPPREDFRLVLLLPRSPSNGADTTRGQLGRLLEAADGNDRLLAATLTAHGDGGGTADVPVYVHAKVGIVDDGWMTVGSANLNEHSLFNDTELNIVTDDADLARSTRLRLWAEHLQRPRHEVDGDPAEVVDTLWRPLAEEQASREERGLPRTHRLTLLPGVSKRARRLMGPVRGLLVDG